MRNLDSLTEDYARTTVPSDALVSWWQITLIKIGVVLALPAFITGAKLGAEMGLNRASMAITIGALILGVFAACVGTVAASSRLPTSVIIQFCFGTTGAKIVNTILAINLLGWFGVTAELFGNTLSKIIKLVFDLGIGNEVCTVFGGLLMVSTTIFGFNALNKLAKIAVPFMLLMLIMVAWVAMKHSPVALAGIDAQGSLSMGLGISAVVGGMVVGTTIFPDIARYARSENHGRFAGLSSYWFGVPIVLILAAIPSIVTGEHDLMLVMLELGMGSAAFPVLIFVAWTTNAGNLYSSSLFASSIFTDVASWKLTIVAGVIGVGFALIGITNLFIPFLIFLGIFIPPVAGIYLANFYFVKRSSYDPADLDSSPVVLYSSFCAWVIGFGVALITSQDILTLTTIPACDAVLTAFTSYLLIHALLPRFQVKGLS